MCLIAFAHRRHARFPLVVAANRDELHRRPSAPLSFWADCPRILAGRDLLGRGTWLGVSRGGRFAALTNYHSGTGASGRDASPGRPSRGLLVSAFLGNARSTRDYLREVAARGGDYDAFSLVAGDGRELGYYSNHGPAPVILPPGIYGLSNALLDAPWPKVERIKAGMSEVLSQRSWRPGALMELLADRTPPAADGPRDRGRGSGSARRRAALFVRGEHYGTRSSTVLTVDGAGRVAFLERSFEPDGLTWSQAHLEFVIEDA